MNILKKVVTTGILTIVTLSVAPGVSFSTSVDNMQLDTFSSETEEKTSYRYPDITLQEAEIYDLIKIASFIKPKIKKKFEIHLRKDFEPEISEIVKNIMEGKIYGAKEKMNDLTGKMSILKEDNIENIQTKSIVYYLKSKTEYVFGNYKEAFYYQKLALKNALKSQDFSIFLMLYPYSFDVFVKNGFYTTAFTYTDYVNKVQGYAMFPQKYNRLKEQIGFTIYRAFVIDYNFGLKGQKRFFDLSKDLIYYGFFQELAKAKTYKTFEDHITSIEKLIEVMYDASTVLSSKHVILKILGAANKAEKTLVKNLRKTNENHYLIGDFYKNKSAILYKLGEYKLSSKYAIAALDVYSRTFREYNRKMLFVYNILTKDAIAMEDPESIKKYVKKTLEILKYMKLDKGTRYIDAMLTLAEAYYVGGNLKEAEKYAQKAYELTVKEFGEFSNQAKIAKHTLDFIREDADVSNIFE